MLLLLHVRSSYLFILKREKECHLCVFFILSSRLRSSSVSVVFDFNASRSDWSDLVLKYFFEVPMTV